MRAPNAFTNKKYYQELKSCLLTHNSPMEVSTEFWNGDSMMSSGTEAVRGRQRSLGKKLQFQTGGMVQLGKEQLWKETDIFAIYPIAVLGRKKIWNYFSFLCNGNTSMSSNLLLRYFNFYPIIHFPKHLCCLQPKADFRSEPLSLFHMTAASRYIWFLASLSVKLNNSESSEYFKSYYPLEASVSLLLLFLSRWHHSQVFCLPVAPPWRDATFRAREDHCI